MPGILDSTPPPGLNPGLLSAQNLVNTNVPEPVTASAVQALSDNLRSGAISAQDVLDRTGELGKVHRKAQIEFHKRQISDLQDPDLVAARHAQELSAGMVARKTGAEAQASMQNIPLGAQTQAAQLKAALWDAQLHGAGLGQMNDVLGLAAWAVPAGDSPQTPTSDTQNEIVRRYQTVIQHQKEMGQAQDFLDKTYKTEMTPIITKDERGVEKTVLKPVITYGGRIYDPAARDAVQKFVADPANQIPSSWDAKGKPRSPHQVPDISVTPNAPAPEVKPTVEIPGQQLPNNQGIVSSIKTPELDTPEKVLKDVQSKDSYKEWDKSLGYADLINQRNIAAQNAPKTGDPKIDNRIQNEKDIALTEAVIKLYDPQGVMRSFKWDKTTETRPIFEYISELKPLLTKEQVLTTPQRGRLMEMANDLIASRERMVRPDLQRIAEVEKRFSTPDHPRQVLNSQERMVAEGTGSMAAKPSVTTAATPGAAAPRVMTKGNGAMISTDGLPINDPKKVWNWAQ